MALHRASALVTKQACRDCVLDDCRVQRPGSGSGSRGLSSLSFLSGTELRAQHQQQYSGKLEVSYGGGARAMSGVDFSKLPSSHRVKTASLAALEQLRNAGADSEFKAQSRFVPLM